jgi:glycerate dehydrogenase
LTGNGGEKEKIVVLDGYTENPGDISWAGLAELGELTVYDRSAKDEIVARIGDAKIALINKAPITAQVMERCPNLGYVGVLATGYNTVDIAAASERGILVSNVPTYGTAAVSQFAIALLLEICHRAGHHDGAVHAGRWQNSVDWCFWDFPQIELAGKTMGIIGFGRIGRTTGRIARALGMKVLAYDKLWQEDSENEDCAYADFEAVISRSDVIALHCPLNDETRECINKDTIAKMKDGVIVINNSRGGLIAERDLADALNGGKVYAAGLDVVSAEPIGDDNPLLSAKNCIITPHISWASKESRQRLMDVATENVARYLAGTPKNIVNPRNA